MDNKDKRYEELLLKKKEQFDKVKNLTENVEFNGKPEDADKYDSLFIKREHFFMQVSKLNKELKSISDSGFRPSKYAARLEQDIKLLVQSIIQMDEDLKKKAEEIKNVLALEIKDINQGKKATIAYGYDVDSAGISHFDSKR